MINMIKYSNDTLGLSKLWVTILAKKIVYIYKN